MRKVNISLLGLRFGKVSFYLRSSLRRILIIVLTLCFIMTPIIAQAAEKVTITLAGWGPGEETFKAPWAMIKEAFEKKYPNISLKLEGIPYENLREQLVIRSTTGVPPDIAQIDSAIDLELAAMGVLTPLDDLISAKLKGDLVPALLENSKYQGKLYAIPQSPVPYILYLNTILREKAGFKDAPKTVEELEEQARGIAKLGTDEKGNKIWGFSPDTARWVVATYDFLPWFYNFGATEFDREGKVAINSAEAVAALSWYQKLAKEGILGPPGSDVREMRNFFSKDILGFYIDNPGGRGIIRDQSGLGKEFDTHYEISTFPTKALPEPWGIYYAHSFVVFKQSKYKEAAMKFLEFAVSDPETTKKYYQMTGMMPPTLSNQKDPVYSDLFATTVLKQAQYVKRPFGLRPDKHGELVDLMAVAIQRVVVALDDPKEALDEAAKKMRAVLREK